MDIDAIDRQVRKLTAFMERMEPIVIAFEAYQSAKAKTELDEDEATFSPAVEPHEDDDHNDITKIKNPMTAEETRQAIMRTPVYVEEANPSIILPQPEAVDEAPEVDPIDLTQAPVLEGASPVEQPAAPVEAVPVDTNPVEAIAAPVDETPVVEPETLPVEETPVVETTPEALSAPDVEASTTTDEKAATEPVV